MALINMAAYTPCTEVEGPGKRFALWVQGCMKRCPDCCNPHMLELVRANIVDVESILTKIEKAKEEYDIEGVTFLGGEPFLQAKGLSVIAKQCRLWGLSVMVFSGYTIKELEKDHLEQWKELFEQIDLLVDGPYLREQPEDKRRWAGSKNQSFHFLTDFYKPGIELLAEEECREIEIRVGKNGEMAVNGWPLIK